MLGLGVPADAYDRVVTSGDVTRDLIAEGPRKVFHIGCERELTIYDGLDVELVEEFEASGSSAPDFMMMKVKHRTIIRNCWSDYARAIFRSSVPIRTLWLSAVRG